MTFLCKEGQKLCAKAEGTLGVDGKGRFKKLEIVLEGIGVWWCVFRLVVVLEQEVQAGEQ